MGVGCSVECEQVAEWLMAADCKSAAPCELRRFESSPVHQVFPGPPARAAVACVGVVEMKRLWAALGLYSLQAVLAWTAISGSSWRLWQCWRCLPFAPGRGAASKSARNATGTTRIEPGERIAPARRATQN